MVLGSLTQDFIWDTQGVLLCVGFRVALGRFKLGPAAVNKSLKKYVAKKKVKTYIYSSGPSTHFGCSQWKRKEPNLKSTFLITNGRLVQHHTFGSMRTLYLQERTAKPYVSMEGLVNRRRRESKRERGEVRWQLPG